MCVVALAWQVHPDWPLILIGNRDEFHDRPSAPLGPWDDGSGIVAGRDLQAGGTWMGLHAPSGRVVVVTNVRGEMPDPARESRGALVVDLLRGTGRFADPDEAELDRFNAFNLFAVDGTARLFTNRPGPRILALTPRSEEHTSELQSLMRISYAVFCLKKKKKHSTKYTHNTKHYNIIDTKIH